MENEKIKDYGYSKINWEAATAENVEAVEGKYRLKLGQAVAGWSDLEQKSRFVLTGLIAIATALTGWAYANFPLLKAPYALAMGTLCILFVAAAFFAALSLRPYGYSTAAGVTPDYLNVEIWAPLLNGEGGEMTRLRGIRIKEYARGIDLCDEANRRKSCDLRLSIETAMASFPVSLAVLIASSFLDPAHSAVASPILLGGIAGIGACALWLLRRRVCRIGRG